MNIKTKIDYQLAIAVVLLIILFSVGIYNLSSSYSTANPQLTSNKCWFLKLVLIIEMITTIAIMILVRLFLFKKVFNPISSVVKKTEEMTGVDFAKKNKDEIIQLSLALNHAFEIMQKRLETHADFVVNSYTTLSESLKVISEKLSAGHTDFSGSKESIEFMTSIAVNIDNIDKFISDLIEYEKTDKNLSALSCEKIQMDKMVGRIKDNFMEKYPDFEIETQVIDNYKSEISLMVFGNKYLLEKAMYNIIENAYKFSDNKKVIIMLESYDYLLRVSFINKGPALGREEVEKIGKPFYRALNAKDTEGYGFGLAYAHKIILQHLGNISFNSEVNGTTEVDIYLPNIKNLLYYCD